MRDYRNVWTLIVAVGLLQVSAGLLGVITPLGLESLGISPVSIGAIAGVYGAGFMIGSTTALRALILFGNIRVFSIAAALTAAASLAMELYPNPGAWTLFRLVQGAGFAWMLASAESWLSSAVPADHRGDVTGFYHVVGKAALMLGPFLAAGASALDPRAYLWCGVFLALALVPICLTRRSQPARPNAIPLPFTRLYRLAPSAVTGVFFSGLVTTGTLALLPIFAQYLPINAPGGSATGLAAMAMASASFGGLLIQWPAGRISDRMDRRVVILVLSLTASAAAGILGLHVERLPGLASLALLTVWGAGSFAFYGVSIAHGIDRAPPGAIARVMSGLLFIWASGAVIGPLLSGTAMRAGAGPGGLFLWAAALSFILAGLMLVRFRLRPSVPRHTQARWKLAQPTSVAGGSIDPRSKS